MFYFKDYFNSKKEYFSNSYQKCLSKGYTKEFCVTTPVSFLGPTTCMCKNGTIGRRLLGFRGKCICDNNAFPYQKFYL